MTYQNVHLEHPGREPSGTTVCGMSPINNAVPPPVTWDPDEVTCPTCQEDDEFGIAVSEKRQQVG